MENRPDCPVERTFSIIGGKWKAPILWQLQEGPLRYGEIKRRFPNITQKMLTQQLRELEADGLVTRTIYTQVPPKVEYALADWGRRLIPVIEVLSEWGMSYLAETEGYIFATNKCQCE